MLNYLLDFHQANSIDILDERSHSADERIRALESENLELRLRVAALIRLLAERGVIQPEEYGKTVNELRSQLQSSPSSPKPKTRAAVKSAKPKKP